MAFDFEKTKIVEVVYHDHPVIGEYASLWASIIAISDERRHMFISRDDLPGR